MHSLTLLFAIQVLATPAISEDTLYFRTRRHVVAIRSDPSPRR